MSVKSFKFVSPGIFVNEVDNSQLPRLPEDMGPVIIGRAERGPAMVPVKVNSFSEFVETFGEPIAGGQADDAWRQGNRLGPTYGAFAAQAYLRNGSPITFVRLLGEAHPYATAGGEAGWSMGGAHGIFVGDDGATADKLAAIIYTNYTSQTAVSTAMASTPGDINITISETAGEVAGSVASEELVVSDITIGAGDPDPDTDPGTNDGVPADQIRLYHLDAQNGARVLALDVTFDNTTSENILTGAGVGLPDPMMLVVGTGNVATKRELAEQIAAGINQAGSEVKLTASAALGTGGNWNVTVVCDEVGELGQNIIDLADTSLGPNGSGVHPVNASFSALNFNDGQDFQAGQVTDKNYIVNFDRNSKKYIRNILNTNPTLTNNTISESPEEYFLGPTFDQFLEQELTGDIDVTTAEDLNGFENSQESTKASATPWVLSQFTGSYVDQAAALTPDDLTRLFRFHSLYSGEWEQKNFKISIVDIKPPANDFVKYGTFSVLIRSAVDNDASQVVYERYSNVNLDPTSSRYIAAVIGDMKMEWRDNEKRYVSVGEHANQSRYIRVEMAGDVDSGAANPELLPFGFAVPSHADAVEFAGREAKFHLRAGTAADSKLGSPSQACFGVSTDRPDTLGRFDESYRDMVRPLKDGADMFSGTDLFSLDLIVQDGIDATFALAQGAADAFSNNLAINNPDPNQGVIGDYSLVLSAGFDKFTLPLCGGLDGLDITEIEPFNDRITGAGNAISSYAYNSISKAIDTVADPEVVECNLMAIPGVATAGLTGKLVATCEARADALAVIDLEYDYTPRGWNTDSESSRLPLPDQAVSALKARGLSSSYGCSFFPWVQVSDDINNRKLWMPPSVVALGTMASSAAKSELWFAPAGFTRGGLSAGAGGLPVSQVRMRLNSKERDALYEANINPIAQFPAEGIVVFGQKTLQVTPSALDRINVRRLMIYVKKEISRMAATTLFDQNVRSTWNRFLGQVEPFLDSVQTRFGLTEYKVILDETTTTPELIDRNIMYAKVFLKPARAIEFIAIDFVITNTGASFED